MTGITSTAKDTFGFSDVVASEDGFSSTTDQRDVRTYNMPLSPGTGPQQADRGYHDHQTITNASVTYTLSAMPNGQAIAHARQLRVEILSPIGTVGSATVGPGATHGWTAGLGGNVPMTPKGRLDVAWPDAGAPVVAAGSNDQVTITVVGTLEFSFDVLGTST